MNRNIYRELYEIENSAYNRDFLRGLLIERMWIDEVVEKKEWDDETN